MKFDYFYIIYFLIIFVIFIGVRIILKKLRDKSLLELNNLLHSHQFFLYQELLNNKRLRFIFRKQVIDIMRLNGFLFEGKSKKAIEMINKLDETNLEPYEKLDYYQKRFSFYVGLNDKKESYKSLEMIRKLLDKVKSTKAKGIILEAELIYEIYINHNTRLIEDLKSKIDLIKDPVIKGITEYRIAKLYYYDKNQNQVNVYLDKAKEDVKGSYWYPIVLEAIKDHSILALK